MANITHFSIADNSKSIGIDADQFYVEFANVSYPLSMDFDLCASKGSTIFKLSSFIHSHDEGISDSMETRLESEFGGEATEAVVVMIDVDPFELRRLL